MTQAFVNFVKNEETGMTYLIEGRKAELDRNGSSANCKLQIAKCKLKIENFKL